MSEPNQSAPAADGAPSSSRDHVRVELEDGSAIHFAPLLAWDSIKYAERFGHPIEALDQDGSTGVIWLAWRAARNAGYQNGEDNAAAFESFARRLRLGSDTTRVSEVVTGFFVKRQTPS